jgi:hypothetical protein
MEGKIRNEDGDGMTDKIKGDNCVGKENETYKIVGSGTIRFWGNSKLFYAVRDYPFRGFQEPGRLGHISSRVFEGIDDQLFLIVSHCPFKGKGRDRTGLLSGLKGRGKVVAVDDPIGAEENGPFYGILELSHIARPMVLREHVDRWS